MGGGLWVRTVLGVLRAPSVCRCCQSTFLPFSHQLRDPHARQPKEGPKFPPQVPGAQLISVQPGTCPWEQAIDLLPGFHPWYQSLGNLGYRAMGKGSGGA